MASSVAQFSLSENLVQALFLIQRYRFLTVRQTARVTNIQDKSASEMLLRAERHGLLGSFGNVGQRGFGKTPKVYFLKPKGYQILISETGLDANDVGTFKTTKINSRWSPVMYHRLATLDALLAAESAVQQRPWLRLSATFFEYRQEKHGRTWRAETSDYVADPEVSENRIVPDAGFVLESLETGARQLFFIEADMGTERITSTHAFGKRQALTHKFIQYERYRSSQRFQIRYQKHGDFSRFRLLFITTTDEHSENVRQRAAESLHANGSGAHTGTFFSTHERVQTDLLGQHWLKLDTTDKDRHPLARESNLATKGEG